MKNLLTSLVVLVAGIAWAAGGWTTAESQHVKWTLPVRDGRLSFELVPGVDKQHFSLMFDDGSRGPTNLAFRTVAQTFTVKQKSGEKKTTVWEDSGVHMSGIGEPMTIYTRTLMQGRYTEEQKAAAVTNAAPYGEVASRHVFRFDLRFRRGRWELWIDRNFAKAVPCANALRAVTVAVYQPSAKYRLVTPEAWPSDPLVERLPDIAPFAVADCAENLGFYVGESDGYRMRRAYDGMRDCYLRRVPVAGYGRAVVRCRLGGDTHKTTEVTARLTRFELGPVGRASNGMTQQTKTIRRVPGKSEYEVEFEFDVGKIQDLVWMCGYEALDFEVLGGVRKGGYVAHEEDKPSLEKSDVIVLGATLYRLSATVCVRNGNHANLFLADSETPHLTAEVAAAVAGRYRLGWRLLDVYGKTVFEDVEGVELSAGETRSVARRFENLPYGWYGVETRLEDAKGALVMSRASSFVLLAPDTRKAGYDSPYYTWLPTSVWYSKKEETYGPACDVVQRLGIRRATVWWLDEEKLSKWGMTCNPSPIPSAWGMAVRFPDKAKRRAEFDRVTQDYARRFPHADWAQIFHENYSGPVPQEAVGGVTKIDEKQAALDRLHAQYGNELAEAWRRTRPDMKFMVGNSSDSLGICGEVLRGGIKKEYVNGLGEELTAGSRRPESVGAYNPYLLRELGRAYGYDAPPGCCYEWRSRPRRLFDSDRQLAAVTVRDVLVAHAWRSPTITMCTKPEPNYSYYHSTWGAGSFTREPLWQPYPVAAAEGTLTRVLDCVRFVRRIDTGSKSVYCLEFERKAPHEFVYALWSAHGWTKGTLKTACRKVLKTGCYGEERMTRGTMGLGAVTLETEVGEEPCYFTMEKPLVSVLVSTARRTYPLDVVPPVEKASRLPVVLNAETDWRLERGEGYMLRVGTFFCRPIRNVIGDFALRTAKDREMGEVVEMELRPVKPLQSDLFGEYAVAMLKDPVPLPADAHTVGVWVKGNSCGGKIYYWVGDGKGNQWVTAGQAGGERYDDSEMMTLNFDGWRLVPFPIAELSPVRNYSLHMDTKQWMGAPNNKRDSEFKPPFRLLGIGVALKRKTLMLTELEPSSSLSVRFGPFLCWRTE